MSAPVILGIMTVLFLGFGYLGVPVAFSLMAGVFIGAAFTDVTFPALIQKVFDGMDSEALLAIPFFLLVGELMSSANVVSRITNLSLALVGHIRGGLSQVVTVFSMFFSEMSGSTTADVAVISRALAGPMKQEGYSPAFIAAIIAAASTIAALVPPSITAVVYGAVGNVSIAGLFMAGVVPGFMIGFGLMIYCYFFGPAGMRRPRAPMRIVGLAFKDASLPLMIPFILLGGILTGWFTPTEAGVVAVFWIIAVVIPVLNRGHLKKLPYDFCMAGLIFSTPVSKTCMISTCPTARNSKTMPNGMARLSKYGAPTLMVRFCSASTMRGNTVPSSTTKAKPAKSTLLARNAPSREIGESIEPGERNRSPRHAIRPSDTTTTMPKNVSR